MKRNSLFTAILLTVLLTAITTTTYAQICYTCPDYGNNVSDTAASALGRYNTVHGKSSAAIGNNNTISSGSGFIAGAFSTINSSSTNSYIIGGFNTIFTGGQESYIFGSGSEALASRVMLIGHRLKSGSTNQIIIGAGPVGGFLTSNKMHSLAVGFKSTFPTFFVSESPSSSRTGMVSIGNTTDPQAKLHIKADAAEDATMFLEATGTNKISSFLMGGGQAFIGTSDENSLSLVTNNSQTRVFVSHETGNVGIGTIEPSAKFQVTDGDIFIENINRGIIMKSPDGNCWRGVLNNQGQLEFVMLPDCLTTSVSDNMHEDKPLFRISPNPASGFLQIGCTAQELIEFSEYSLFNSAGDQLKTGKLDKTTITINIQGLATGAYILNFSGPYKFWSEKVIIR